MHRSYSVNDGIDIDLHPDAWVMMGPTMCLHDIPWNIEIDSLQGTLRLLEDRLQCLVMILQEWGDREVCTIGVASEIAESCLHACKVVHPGRSSHIPVENG